MLIPAEGVVLCLYLFDLFLCFLYFFVFFLSLCAFLCERLFFIFFAFVPSLLALPMYLLCYCLCLALSERVQNIASAVEALSERRCCCRVFPRRVPWPLGLRIRPLESTFDGGAKAMSTAPSKESGIYSTRGPRSGVAMCQAKEILKFGLPVSKTCLRKA